MAQASKGASGETQNRLKTGSLVAHYKNATNDVENDGALWHMTR